MAMVGEELSSYTVLELFNGIKHGTCGGHGQKENGILWRHRAWRVERSALARAVSLSEFFFSGGYIKLSLHCHSTCGTLKSSCTFLDIAVLDQTRPGRVMVRSQSMENNVELILKVPRYLVC